MSFQVTPRQASSSVLLIGDSCLDVYFFGTCVRLSPEAPVPVLKYEREERRPGMVNNVAENLQGLGLHTSVICPERTVEKHRFVDTQRMTHLLRVDIPDIENANEHFNHDMIEDIDWLQINSVVISDYNKGFLTADDIRLICDICTVERIPVFIDTKKRDLTGFHGIIKLNDLEHSLVTKFPESSFELVVTQGAKGALWRGTSYPSENVQMFDVCGAGDTFMAGLVAFYTQTYDIEASIKFANKCAAVAVKHFGTYAIKCNDLL